MLTCRHAGVRLIGIVFLELPSWLRVLHPRQFKDYPEKGAASGDLVETFLKYAGFYLHYHNEKIPDVVRGWKVCASWSIGSRASVAVVASQLE